MITFFYQPENLFFHINLDLLREENNSPYSRLNIFAAVHGHSSARVK
jgi:hypothetical protein